MAIEIETDVTSLTIDKIRGMTDAEIRDVAACREWTRLLDIDLIRAIAGRMGWVYDVERLVIARETDCGIREKFCDPATRETRVASLAGQIAIGQDAMDFCRLKLAKEDTAATQAARTPQQRADDDRARKEQAKRLQPNN